MKGLLFRCDFGGASGWGHLVRCSALAQAARTYGFATGLVAQGNADDLPEELTFGFDALFPLEDSFPQIKFWEKMLEEDARWDAVIVDHYGYDAGRLGPLFDFFHDKGVSCIQVGDFPRQFHRGADVIVCPGFSGEGLDLDVFGKGKVCAGLEYTLLRSAFDRQLGEASSALGALPNVAVVLGGTDPSGLMPQVLDGLFHATEGHCVPSVIIPSGVDYEGIQRDLTRFDSHKLHMRLSSDAVVDVFYSCDYGITACGGTVYEMAALGLPFVGLCVADNQEKTAQCINQAWSLPIVKQEDFSSETFLAAWHRLRRAFPSGKSAYAAIDARGPERVLSAIIRSSQVERLNGPAQAGHLG